MVTEFAEHGSMEDLIKKKIDGPISEKLRMKFILDAAKAIHYLHSNHIMHRDIEPDNFLIMSLDENVTINVKLTDFGVSRNVSAFQSVMNYTKNVGSPAYMAPEIIKRVDYGVSVDIYSFAITMLEIIIWRDAFPNDIFRFAWDIAQLIVTGKRPNTIEQVENKSMKELIEDCWKQEPRERLNSHQLVERIKEIYNSY